MFLSGTKQEQSIALWLSEVWKLLDLGDAQQQNDSFFLGGGDECTQWLNENGSK
jgi:hypothetical protein